MAEKQLPAVVKSNLQSSTVFQGVGDGQGGLVCCNTWGRKESDTTERLNGTELFPLLELCPQVYSLSLHLHCCPANKFINTIFLDSVYMS